MATMINYIKDSFEELKNNVSWTERSELQRLVVIVLIFSVLFIVIITPYPTLHMLEPTK